MHETLERNRQNAMSFYDLMFNQCKPAGKIGEHWDVLQAVPSESANGNSMF
jgi:predicted SnoaL-like aldol condensation-catalyzing enzyme